MTRSRTSQRDKIVQAADDHGWHVHVEPSPGHIGVTEFRKRTGRSVSYVRVYCGVNDQVIEASWADNLQGNRGRAIVNSDKNKLAWVLNKLAGNQA